jgi:hypothetical protein
MTIQERDREFYREDNTMPTLIPALSMNLALVLFASVSWAEELPDREPGSNQEQRQSTASHGRHQARQLIESYMLSQGDLSQADIDQSQQERQSTREKFKALKQAGDKEGLSALRSEMKAKKQQRREEIKQYLEQHPELQQQLEQHRQQVKQKRRDCLKNIDADNG